MLYCTLYFILWWSLNLLNFEPLGRPYLVRDVGRRCGLKKSQICKGIPCFEINQGNPQNQGTLTTHTPLMKGVELEKQYKNMWFWTVLHLH